MILQIQIVMKVTAPIQKYGHQVQDNDNSASSSKIKTKQNRCFHHEKEINLKMKISLMVKFAHHGFEFQLND